MRDDAPFGLDHAGFIARFKATREERMYSVIFVLFAPLWTAMMGFAVFTEGGLGARMCCMLTTVPFIWGVSVIGAEAAVTRRVLRLANGQLQLETRKLLTRRRLLDARDLRASAHEEFGSKGGRRAWLQLDLADGETVVVTANNWRQEDLRELAAIVDGCASEAGADTALVPPEALQALRGVGTAG